MTIQRRNRTRRLQFELLEARDVPSVVSPHAGLLRPMARAEVHKAAHHHVQAPVIHRAPASVAASGTAGAGAASSSTPPAGGLPGPITVVLGPWMQMEVKEVPAEILYEGPAPPPDLNGSVSST
jgi:hypothetical protein